MFQSVFFCPGMQYRFLKGYASVQTLGATEINPGHYEVLLCTRDDSKLLQNILAYILRTRRPRDEMCNVLQNINRLAPPTSSSSSSSS